MLLLAVLGMATAGTASAQWVGVIETRQAGMALQSGDFAGIRAVVAAKGDVKTLENPAKAIARWIKQFPTLFPAGTEQGHDTKALPAIWSDNGGVPEGGGRSGGSIDQDGGARQGRRCRRHDGAGQGRGDACAACHKDVSGALIDGRHPP